MICFLNSQERKVLLFVSFVLCLGFVFSFLKKPSNCNFCLIDIYSNKARETLNINSAKREDLLKIPGIGSKAADDILAYRSLVGGFKDKDEFDDVKGLSGAAVKILKAYTFVK